MIEGLTVANAYFDSAIEAQPNLSAALVLKADRAAHIVHMSIQIETPGISEVKAQSEALQTELDLAWRASPKGNQRDILNLERTLVRDDWTGLSDLIQRAMQPGDCPRINMSGYIVSLGFADELAAKFEESLACNPMDVYVIFTLARTYVLAGRPDKALELLDDAEAKGVNSKLFNNARLDALLVAGRFDDPALDQLLSEYLMRHLSQSNVADARQMMRHLIHGSQADARQIAEQIWSSPETDLVSSLEIAEMVGDRERANEFAARIDKYPGSAWVLLEASFDCMIWARVGTAKSYRNGILFDVEATPNFMARIEESDLAWPPLAFQDIATEGL
jgi:tetratricopeptide (TPR) repeat protein